MTAVNDLRRQDRQKFRQKILFPEMGLIFGECREIDLPVSDLRHIVKQFRDDFIAVLLQLRNFWRRFRWCGSAGRD